MRNVSHKAFDLKTLNFTFKRLELFVEVMLLKNMHCIAQYQAGVVDCSLLLNVRLWKQGFSLGTELPLAMQEFGEVQSASRNRHADPGSSRVLRLQGINQRICGFMRGIQGNPEVMLCTELPRLRSDTRGEKLRNKS